MELAGLLRTNKKIIVFKSRQVGLSWTMAGYAAWLMTFFDSSKILELSQGESEAFDLLSKTQFILNNHPEWIKFKLDPNQRGLLGIPATNSIAKALPSTEAAGRSTDATLVICDEWEYHPYAANNYAAIKPTISAGGQIVGVSTVDKSNMESFPKEIWDGATHGTNGFTPVFYGWDVVPSRNKEWFDEETRDMRPWVREQEFPATIEEALAPVSAKCYFDQEVIYEMLKDCTKPIEERLGGNVKIYKKAVAGKKYVFSIDTSEGTGDPCVGVISDWQTGDEVAEFHGKITVDEQAKIISDLYNEYNSPFICVERNADGRRLIDKLKALEITNWYYDPKDKKREKPGWWTTDTNRPFMLGELAEAIYKRLIRIPNKEALAEFLSFIRTDSGKAMAIGGRHDDYVMAWAIMWQVRKFMPIPAGKVKSVKYRES